MVLLIGTILFIRLGYIWGWTGFNYRLEVKDQVSGKYLWDWLDLLVVPTVLAGLGLLFNYTQRKNELEISEKERRKDRDIAQQSVEVQQAIETDRLRENILQTYFDRMAELIIGINNTNRQGEVIGLINVGRARTLTILRQLDPERKGFVVRFLAEAKLIEAASPVIKLNGCDLSDIRLERFTLPNINLSGADLSSAQIFSTNLIGSDLSNTRIANANFSDCLFQKVNFSRAKIIETQLVRTSLFESNFQDSEIVQSLIVDCILTDANFRNANLVSLKFFGDFLSPEQIHQTKKIVDAEVPHIGKFTKTEE